MNHDICPIAVTAEILGDTWVILIVRDLLQGPKRFCELEKSLEGISTRTLTLKLKLLEEKGVLKKEVPYYELRERGRQLAGILEAMEAWGADLHE